ncbi:MAG: hypothetical protein JWO25_2244 [Alphaproteobacteria bacterium]|nr:hypothetical protein [Alphaproteobacteria bacterium]
MTSSIVSTVFDSRAEAERAITQLRTAGVAESAISIVAQHDGSATTTTGDGVHDEHGVARGLGVGAGVGALFGLAALAIPGVGPFIAAGALANAFGAAGGAIAAGAIVGGTAGGLTNALTSHGISAEDSAYYEDSITKGGVFVSVDTDNAGIDPQTAEDILYSAGGHSATRARTAAL